jgi:2-keto-4-pentenoate hydratase
MEEAARLIWESWNAGQVITHLPYHLIPNTRADAYEIQSYYEIFSGKPIFGWKIAATSSAGQQHIGVDSPIAGRILHERVFDPGVPLLFGSNRMAVAEPEFAFRMKDTLISRMEEYSKSEVMSAVDTLHSAIEIPNSRFEDFSKMGDKQLIVDNACAHELVIGPAMCESWRKIDLSKHRVLISVGGQSPNEGSGSNVLGDPRIALTW